MQIAKEVPTPNLPLTLEPGPVYFETTRVSVPNDISLRSTAVARRTSVTDRQTDRPRSGNICPNSRGIDDVFSDVA